MDEEKPIDLLMGERYVFHNLKGETVFALRRKEFGDQIYYMFELHRDRLEPELVAKFEAYFELIKQIGAAMKMALYDCAEVHAQLNAYMKKNCKEIAEKLGKLALGEQYDITITVTDVNTGKKNSLTMGMSLPKDLPQSIESRF